MSRQSRLLWFLTILIQTISFDWLTNCWLYILIWISRNKHSFNPGHMCVHPHTDKAVISFWRGVAEKSMGWLQKCLVSLFHLLFNSQRIFVYVYCILLLLVRLWNYIAAKNIQTIRICVAESDDVWLANKCFVSATMLMLTNQNNHFTNEWTAILATTNIIQTTISVDNKDPLVTVKQISIDHNSHWSQHFLV